MLVVPFFQVPSTRCGELASVNAANFGVSLFILIGILVSYLPQHIRIITRGSSFGISPFFVLLGTTSGTSAFLNMLSLPATQTDMACCRQLNGFSCFAAMLGVLQVGTQWLCFVVILILFLVFFPRATPPTSHPDTDPKPSFRTALAVVAVCIAHAIITAILSFYFVLVKPEHQQGWANFLGVFAAILASIQYFPQIWTTFRLKTVASLSIPMMCIQTPGSFVWAASLASRLGPDGWSQWGIYVITGTLQGTLLVMGSYFELQNRRKEKKELQARMAAGTNNSQVAASEETPLLRPSD